RLLLRVSGVGAASLPRLAPPLPGLVTKFAADPASVQLTISLYLLGLAVAPVLFGPLSDRFRRRAAVVAAPPPRSWPRVSPPPSPTGRGWSRASRPPPPPAPRRSSPSALPA